MSWAAHEFEHYFLQKHVIRTAIGGVLFAGFLWLCWVTFIRRLWKRGYDPAITQRGTGLKAVFH